MSGDEPRHPPLTDRSCARIGEGRCLSYGEGITYWPLSQIVRQLAVMGEADARDLAPRKLEALCEGAADANAIVDGYLRRWAL